MEDQEKKGFACNECDYVSQFKHDVDRHMRKHTGEKPYSCVICDKSFAIRGNRNRHQLTHTGEKRFQCDLCLVKFTEKGSLTKHKRIHTGKNLFECSYCSKKFTQNGHLKAHVQIHTGEKIFKCSYCDKRFAQKVNLDEHTFVHKRTEFPCSKCNVVLTNYSAFKKHRRRHVESKRIVCSLCGKQLESYGFKRHMQLIHQAEEPYHCGVCNKPFRSKHLLKKHSVVHTIDKPFHCSQCKKEFVKKDNFRRHMQQYKGEFYNCPHCNIGFVCRSDLDEHWEMHSDKPIICSDCNEVFSSLTALKLHNHNHMYERNLRCPFCDTAFTRKTTLVTHVRRKHKAEGLRASENDVEQPFDCPACEEKFSTENLRLWHEIYVHGSLRRLLTVDNKNTDINRTNDDDAAGKIAEKEVDGSKNTIGNSSSENVIYVKEETIDEDSESEDPLDVIETFGKNVVFIQEESDAGIEEKNVIIKEDVDAIVIKEEDQVN